MMSDSEGDPLSQLEHARDLVSKFTIPCSLSRSLCAAVPKHLAHAQAALKITTQVDCTNFDVDFYIFSETGPERSP